MNKTIIRNIYTNAASSALDPDLRQITQLKNSLRHLVKNHTTNPLSLQATLYKCRPQSTKSSAPNKLNL